MIYKRVCPECGGVEVITIRVFTNLATGEVIKITELKKETEEEFLKTVNPYILECIKKEMTVEQIYFVLREIIGVSILYAHDLVSRLKKDERVYMDGQIVRLAS